MSATQRIHLNPNAPRGPVSGGYTPAASAYRPNSGPTIGAQGGNEVLGQVQALSSKVEDYIEAYTQPIRPYVPAMARFLIVVTFLEDALRILTQWGDQLWYLQKHRHFPWGISHIFLLINVITMISCSFGVITKRYPEYSVFGLLGVVIAQGIGYGLLFDLSFFLRNLSVIGGLLMVLSDSLQNKKKLFAGLPSISETDRRKYFQLAGRILLIFLFIGFIFQGKWSFARVLVSVVGLGACIMVAVGFKAKWSASFLVTLLSVFNVFINNWWSVHSAHPQRDFLKYDFFQTLSIVGGLLLLVNIGPGGISVDEKKKVY
ncbi:ER to Golgi transport-related protein [Papiliotrema laurentii]|uniref:ER to Golgi transport-related protein n=1 Tax=Papiliotrema laurentii TaxID=5418 RepID=A0AAD9CYQ4_PAPLA|nr:ER to Golgi transport-related protein [Papiliotrema laurentii]